MSKRIYWQNLEEEACGWVETDLCARIISQDPMFEVHIEKQTYDLRVLENFHIHAPTSRMLLDDHVRSSLFNSSDKVIQLTHNFKAHFQNPGVEFDSKGLRRLRNIREDINKTIDSIIKSASKNAKEYR
jgi:hypothetical protein